jgi:hypothetical protein
MSSKRKMRRRSPDAVQTLEIVHGPIPQAWHSQLASEIREAMPGLHALVHEDPRAAVTELRAWIEREPLPMFYNWLSAAYSALGEAEAVGTSYGRTTAGTRSTCSRASTMRRCASIVETSPAPVKRSEAGSTFVRSSAAESARTSPK